MRRRRSAVLTVLTALVILVIVVGSLVLATQLA
jgi:hypothetical protein